MKKRTWTVRIPWPDGTAVSLAILFDGPCFDETKWEGRWFRFLLDRIVKHDRPRSGSDDYFDLSFPLLEAVDAGLGESVEDLGSWLFDESPDTALLLGWLAWKGPGDAEGEMRLSSGARLQDGEFTIQLCPLVPWEFLRWALIDASELIGGETCQSD